MKLSILCPNCRALSNWSSYFQRYNCTNKACLTATTFEDADNADKVNTTWPDVKEMSKVINVLLERINKLEDQVQTLNKIINAPLRFRG